MRNRPIFLIFLALLASLAAPSSAHAQQTSPRSILLVLGETPTWLERARFSSAIRKTVTEGWSGPVTFDVEHLDLSWFTTPAYEEKIRAFYLAKYRANRPDVMIVARTDALRIFLEVRASLWPDVPVVYLAESERAAAEFPSTPAMTGVWETYDMRRTVEVAMEMLPQARRIVLISGVAPWDSTLRAIAEEQLAPLRDRIELVERVGVPVSELQREVAGLPDDTLIFFVSLILDNRGQRLTSEQAMRSLLPEARRPIVTIHEALMGDGVLGGALMDCTPAGRRIGEIALRALHGEPIGGIPPAEVHRSDLVFDARALRRWHVPESRVPAGAELRFRESSLWERYRGLVLAVLGAGALLLGLVIVLLVERRRRIRAQASLDERLRLERLVGEISMELAGLRLPRIDDCLIEWLGRIAELLDMDRVCLWRFAADGQSVRRTHASQSGAAPPPPMLYSMDEVPMSMERVQRGEVVTFPMRPDDASASDADRATFARTGLRALVVVPVSLGGDALGCLTLGAAGSARVFSEGSSTACDRSPRSCPRPCSARRPRRPSPRATRSTRRSSPPSPAKSPSSTARAGSLP